MTWSFIKTPILITPIILAACATTVPYQYTSNTESFNAVAVGTKTALGKSPVWIQTKEQSQAVNKKVNALIHQKTISADTAVQVALMNNKGLQASYSKIGISSAEAWQQSIPENPIVSIGIFGIGAPELGVYRAIEGMIATNLLDAKTRKQRIALADTQFQQAQLNAVNDTLALATETRRAWINAVSAFEVVANLNRVSISADASSELAKKLGETGALAKAGQAREHAFNAEIAGQTAKARLDAKLAKEELTRLMGLWGTGVNYFVPDALPALPRSISKRRSIEVDALKNRVDLQVAKLGLEATAKSFGMVDASRYITDLELIAGFETERENDEGNTSSNTTPQIELEFAIPIFDTGKARLRKAELAYMQSANILAEMAVNIRSEARSAEAEYHGSYEIARHYRDTVVPLRTTIGEEAQLSYNGMITNTFEYLSDNRDLLSALLQADAAKRDFWLAKANLKAAIYGGGASSGAAGGAETTVASSGSGGH